jgi:hypothetical protein
MIYDPLGFEKMALSIIQKKSPKQKQQLQQPSEMSKQIK